MLKIQPYSGQPLGYDFIREKKFNGKRLIFLVYDEYNVVFLVTISDKKTQKKDINIIKASLEYYKDYIQKIIN
ncbi:MAG: hypothetical protein AABX19_02425 [Nanoarchaeota archaeon]